jgi:NADPH:quinone reductase-like Zn-dependent oxidoreductase
VLNPRARLVIVGAPSGNAVAGPLGRIAKVLLAALPGSRKAVFFIAKLNKPDLAVLRELVDAGKLTSVVERRYELSESADAFRYMGEGHAQGKIVVTMSR